MQVNRSPDGNGYDIDEKSDTWEGDNYDEVTVMTIMKLRRLTIEN